jgi:hypothetical protein
VSLKIIVGFVQRLPDSIQVGLTVGAAWCAIRLPGKLHDFHAHHRRNGKYSS